MQVCLWKYVGDDVGDMASRLLFFIGLHIVVIVVIVIALIVIDITCLFFNDDIS